MIKTGNDVVEKCTSKLLYCFESIKHKHMRIPSKILQTLEDPRQDPPDTGVCIAMQDPPDTGVCIAMQDPPDTGVCIAMQDPPDTQEDPKQDPLDTGVCIAMQDPPDTHAGGSHAGRILRTQVHV